MDNTRRPDTASAGPRRVFTAPTYAGPSSDQASSAAKGGVVETLYNHPSVKIVAFSAGPRPVFSHGKGIAPPEEVEPGSLPWSSQMERTIAAGQFRIYRAPGSVAFLSCGSALQPILPKSQCWSIDEESSKYVLQIRRPQYWRIEVPVGSEDDTRRALELRGVLDQILQFEKTECPFKRGFTVDLPDRPQTPAKKRPWTPVSRRSSSAFLPPTPVTPEVAPIHRPKDDAAAGPDGKPTVPVYIPDVLLPLTTSEPKETAVAKTTVLENDLEGDAAVTGTVEGAVSALEYIARERTVAETIHTNSSSILVKPSGFQANRSVTAPPQLTLVTAPALKPVSVETTSAAVAVPEPERIGSRSPTDSSNGSFHSVESWTSTGAPLPPSPPLTVSGSPTVAPYSKQYLYVPKKAHVDESADLTITPNTPRTLTGSSSDGLEPHQDDTANGASSGQDDEASSTCSVRTADESLRSLTITTQTDLSSPRVTSNQSVPASTTGSTIRTTSASSSSSTVLTRRPYMRHRPTASSSISPSRGALNRLPSAADLFPTYRSSSYSSSVIQSKPAPSRLALVRNLPKAIIHKTIEILLSPPSHLIDLMLKVAARIAAGEWRGYVFGYGEGGERIPVRWDWSDGDDDGEGELGGWGADEDWEFTRTTRRSRRRSSVLRMAGAYPDSPEEVERQLGVGKHAPVPGSPSLERRKARHHRREEERKEDDEERDAATAGGSGDWAGSLSID